MAKSVYSLFYFSQVCLYFIVLQYIPKNQSKICLQSLNQHNRGTATMKDTGVFFITVVLNTMANNIILANKDDPQFFEALQENLQGVKNPNNIVTAGDWSTGYQA